MLNAARVPLETAGMAVEVMELCAQAIEAGNLNAISDGASGAALARASLTGAGYNVRINVASLINASKGEELLEDIRRLERRADQIEASIRTNLVERGGMPLP
jgi:formiminotetrahydrofolate cyclodeaminase